MADSQRVTIDTLIDQVKQGYIAKEAVLNIPNMFAKCSTKKHIEFLTQYGAVAPDWHISLDVIQRIMEMTKIQILEYVIPKLDKYQLTRLYQVCDFVLYEQHIMKDLLWISCYIGSISSVQSILSRGFKPNYGQWYDGEEIPFPLIVACKYGYDKIIKLLISYGAKYDSPSYYFGFDCMKLYLETKSPSLDVVKLLSSRANILYNLNAGAFHKDDRIASFFREEYRKMGPRF
uniref:Ankyrin repeat protein n=1 Tax=viral metagenome TaxID=1070528 RepID=A0A6C0CAT1_9ZZZZ